MRIYLRWFKLLLTCGLGRHLPYTETVLPDGSIYRQCPRCHEAYYRRSDGKGSAHLRPDFWSVARGLYDRGIQK